MLEIFFSSFLPSAHKCAGVSCYVLIRPGCITILKKGALSD
ncbi:hypothetical protein HMPREF1548_05120 [Clostridium sp. KLE 1755]|nr:hypothetical protein HMPREF1548_05120 [Clostridium sp. KLE 1755]